MIRFADTGKVLIYSNSKRIAKGYATATGRIVEILPNQLDVEPYEYNNQDGNNVSSVKQVEISTLIGVCGLIPLIALLLYGFAVIANDLLSKGVK